MLGLFKKKLPCQEELCLANGEVPPCVSRSADLSHFRCPASVKLQDSLENITRQGYRFGYSFVSWVVLKGPSCELVCFQSEPDAEELKQRYGGKLIAVVPV